LLVVNDGGRKRWKDRSFLSLAEDPVFQDAKQPRHASVLNEGARRASGRYIAYLDDDDVYYPDHLESLHNAIVSSGENSCTRTRNSSGGVEGREIRQTENHVQLERGAPQDKLILNNYIANLGVIHEKSVFHRVGLFSEDLTMVMDWISG